MLKPVVNMRYDSYTADDVEWQSVTSLANLCMRILYIIHIINLLNCGVCMYAHACMHMCVEVFVHLAIACCLLLHNTCS